MIRTARISEKYYFLFKASEAGFEAVLMDCRYDDLVFREEKPVKFSGKTALLFAKLLENRNSVTDIEDIRKDIWTETSDKNISNHINKIKTRLLLALEGEKPFIEIKKEKNGYKITAEDKYVTESEIAAKNLSSFYPKAAYERKNAVLFEEPFDSRFAVEFFEKEGKPKKLEEIIKNAFLGKKSHRNFYIEEEGAGGKTFSIKKAAETLEKEKIPSVYIDCAAFVSPSEQFFKQVLGKAEKDFSFKKAAELYEKICVFADGTNEIPKGKREKFLNELSEISSELSESGAKTVFVISGRTVPKNRFGFFEENELFLQKINAADFLKKQKLKNPPKGKMLSLLSKPLFMKLYLEGGEEKETTAAKLLFEDFERNIKKLSLFSSEAPEEIREFLPFLGEKICREEKIVFSTKDFREIFEDWKNERGIAFSSPEEMLFAAKESGYLRFDKTELRFSHECRRDFLAAFEIFIRAQKEENLPEKKDFLSYPIFVRRLFAELFGKEKLLFAAAKKPQSAKKTAAVFEVLKNLPGHCKIEGKLFSETDFSQADLNGIEFKNCRFYNCNFEKSLLPKGLSAAAFGLAEVSGGKFAAATKEGIFVFSEKLEPICSSSFSENGKRPLYLKKIKNPEGKIIFGTVFEDGTFDFKKFSVKENAFEDIKTKKAFACRGICADETETEFVIGTKSGEIFFWNGEEPFPGRKILCEKDEKILPGPCCFFGERIIYSTENKVFLFYPAKAEKKLLFSLKEESPLGIDRTELFKNRLIIICKRKDFERKNIPPAVFVLYEKENELFTKEISPLEPQKLNSSIDSLNYNDFCADEKNGVFYLARNCSIDLYGEEEGEICLKKRFFMEDSMAESIILFKNKILASLTERSLVLLRKSDFGTEEKLCGFNSGIIKLFPLEKNRFAATMYDKGFIVFEADEEGKIIFAEKTFAEDSWCWSGTFAKDEEKPYVFIGTFGSESSVFRFEEKKNGFKKFLLPIKIGGKAESLLCSEKRLFIAAGNSVVSCDYGGKNVKRLFFEGRRVLFLKKSPEGEIYAGLSNFGKEKGPVFGKIVFEEGKMAFCEKGSYSSGWFRSLEFSADGKYLLCAGLGKKEENRALLFEKEGESWNKKAELIGHGDYCTRAVFSSCQKKAITSSRDGKIREYSLFGDESEKITPVFESENLGEALFDLMKTENGKIFAAGIGGRLFAFDEKSKKTDEVYKNLSGLWLSSNSFYKTKLPFDNEKEEKAFFMLKNRKAEE